MAFLNMSLSNSGNHNEVEGKHEMFRNFRERSSD